MKKWSLLVLVAVTQIAFAQKKATKTVLPAKPADQVLFTFGTDTVYRSEFERIYSKNNTSKEQPDEKSIKEYLDLYVNFKLKVKEAKMNGLDTLGSFKQELGGYRKQLAQPYLVDKAVTNQLVKEAYERMKQEVNASHILINCDENALPKDTVAAYNKAMDIRKQLLKGENFDSLAVKYSNDPSAARNYGNLGWFTAFQMIYAFETGAYLTEIGKISMPIRTRFGYHVIKVLGRRPARGEVKAAHIMVKFQAGATPEQEKETKAKIDQAYTKLKGGAKFEDVVKEYSQDESSLRNNGEMNWITSSGNFPTEFKDAAFALKNNGDYSEPVKTPYGWHIIKRIDKKDLPPMKELEENIKTKINRDSRSEINKQAVVERIKKENGFKENALAYKEVLKTVDSTLLQGKWDKERAKGLNKVMFSVTGKNFTQQDFAQYIADYQTPRNATSIDAALQGMYKDYITFKMVEFEEAGLDKKYEDFRNLMQEYHDGILLFDLTDKKVWSKAVNDTVGLQAYYEKNKSRFLYKDRYVVDTYTCADEKTAKAVQKMISSGKSVDEIKAKMNKKNPKAVEVKSRKVETGEDNMLDDACKAAGAGKCNRLIIADKNSASVFQVLVEVQGPQPKDLKDVKGLITAEYQNQLEKDWLAELKAKYPVQVNQATVNTLFK